MTTKTTLTATLAVLAGTAGALGDAPAFAPGTPLATAQQPGAAAAGDFNRDGLMDVAVSADTPDRIIVFYGNGDGTFLLGASLVTGGGTGPDTMRAGDFVGDAGTDLAVVLKNTNALAIYTNAAGVLSQTGQVTLGGDPRALQLVDLNNDGRGDFLTANRDTEDVSVVINGVGGFATSTIAVGDEPRGVAGGDLDGDGDGDVVVALKTSRQLQLYRNDGGSFVLMGSVPVNPNVRPDGLVVVDLDGDGDNDIAVATSGGGFNQVEVFTNTGGGTFVAGAVIASGGQNPSEIEAVDLDADGDLDLVVTNSDTASVGAIENLGAGAFGPAVVFAVGSDPQAPGVGDFDQSGTPDLAIPSKDANTTAILLNTIVVAPACPADLTGSSNPSDPSFGVPDGVLDSNDFFFYLDRFAAGDLAIADLTGSSDPNSPSFGVPDGTLDASDFFFYLGRFAAGCP